MCRFGPAPRTSPRRLPQDPIEVGQRDPVKKAKKGFETQGGRAREARPSSEKIMGHGQASAGVFPKKLSGFLSAGAPLSGQNG